MQAAYDMSNNNYCNFNCTSPLFVFSSQFLSQKITLYFKISIKCPLLNTPVDKFLALKSIVF